MFTEYYLWSIFFDFFPFTKSYFQVIISIFGKKIEKSEIRCNIPPVRTNPPPLARRKLPTNFVIQFFTRLRSREVTYINGFSLRRGMSMEELQMVLNAGSATVGMLCRKNRQNNIRNVRESQKISSFLGMTKSAKMWRGCEILPTTPWPIGLKLASH